MTINIPISVPPVNETLDLNIFSKGNSTAGESISINCTVSEKVRGLVNSPQVTWIGQLGEHVEITGQSAIFSFHILKTSHGNKYTCQGSMDSPALSKPYVVTKEYSLTVNGKFHIWVEAKLIITSSTFSSFKIVCSCKDERVVKKLGRGEELRPLGAVGVCPQVSEDLELIFRLHFFWGGGGGKDSYYCHMSSIF